MIELHTVVCVKVTPKPEEIRVDPETNLLERADVRSEINPPDMNALELALSLKDRYGGWISLLSMGPPLFEPFLRIGLAMGADHAYLLSDRAFGGADTLATTYTLARGIEKIGGVNLIICGEESSDGATGQVPPGLAEWLDVSQITMVSDLDLEINKGVVRGVRRIAGGHELLEVPLPTLVSVKTSANKPRFMDYRIKEWAFGLTTNEAASDPFTIWSNSDIQAESHRIGLPGSPTRVSGLAQAPSQDRMRRFLTGTTKEIADELASILTATL